MSEKIRIFVTGGTFDKKYNELKATLYFDDTHVPEMLRLGRCFPWDRVRKNREKGVFEEQAPADSTAS